MNTIVLVYFSLLTTWLPFDSYGAYILALRLSLTMIQKDSNLAWCILNTMVKMTPRHT